MQNLTGESIVIPPNGNSYVSFSHLNLTELFDVDGAALGPREAAYYRVSFYAAVAGGTKDKSIRVELRRNDQPWRKAARVFSLSGMLESSGLGDQIFVEDVYPVSPGEWIDVRVWVLEGHAQNVQIYNASLIIEKLS